MKEFLVLFAIPAASVDAWVETPEAQRKEAEQKVMSEWKAWMEAHKDSFLEIGRPVGKTKLVTQSGIADTRNDLNWYCIVQANSHDEAAKLFVGHPHLQIPTSRIEIMELPERGV
jgi:hypothetical protein